MTFCQKFYLNQRLSTSNNFKLIMFKITSGRRKESCIWGYFKYNAIVDKSTCQVDNNGVIYGRLISGKRSTAEHPQASATANDAVNPPLNASKQDQSKSSLQHVGDLNSYLRSQLLQIFPLKALLRLRVNLRGMLQNAESKLSVSRHWTFC